MAAPKSARQPPPESPIPPRDPWLARVLNALRDLLRHMSG